MKFILGQKKQMTQIFKEDGTVIPVTAVEVAQNVITQIKTRKNDGYYAVQVGSGVTKKNLRKPQQGHLKDLTASRWLREFRFDVKRDVTEDSIQKQFEKFSRGLTFGVEIFRPGDAVSVEGVSKGRGFQGVVKRHGFSGAPQTHGTKDQVRMPGSVGATGPAHVFKGVRMGGRMGTDTVTVHGLQVVKVDAENNLLYIKGALPGAMNSLIAVFGPGTFKNKPVTKSSERPSEEDAASEDEVKTSEQDGDSQAEEKTEVDATSEPAEDKKQENSEDEQATAVEETKETEKKVEETPAQESSPETSSEAEESAEEKKA